MEKEFGGLFEKLVEGSPVGEIVDRHLGSAGQEIGELVADELASQLEGFSEEALRAYIAENTGADVGDSETDGPIRAFDHETFRYGDSNPVFDPKNNPYEGKIIPLFGFRDPQAAE